jgi:NAD(P)-dependent dehydrogenase (short-subunit alcohol dehydrogenase family)
VTPVLDKVWSSNLIIHGFHVLAGVYNGDNKQVLNDRLSSRAIVFALYITSQQNIDTVFALVQSKTSSLFALVNDAGIADGGLIDWISLASICQVMEVNFFGHVAMTKTFYHSCWPNRTHAWP